eukprot:TRINITY_DN3671_c0_g1_i1.p1 TRINITY_DN3671_c0_g1~~TRINITY_DN3671_c0_g1_i1.p1  ORF type:complete len:830 (-),score=189.53 TRINITY_DN3671_c0_g1_i1:163-2652(-)
MFFKYCCFALKRLVVLSPRSSVPFNYPPLRPCSPFNTLLSRSLVQYSLRMSSSTTTTTTTATATPNTYTQSNDVDEKFKRSIVLFGLDKFCDDKRLAKALKAFEIPYEKIKKIIPNEFALITFSSIEEKNKWMEFLNSDKRIDNKLIKAVDRKMKERRNREEKNFYGEKKLRVDDEMSGSEVVEDIRDRIAPLWKLPYEEQLEKKKKDFLNFLKEITKQIAYDSKYDVPYWIKKLRGRPATIYDGILPSPVQTHYRNKASFSIGYDSAGRPCIGFNEGRLEFGVATIADPSSSTILPLSMIAIRDSVQELVIKSGLPPWDKMTRKGFWRNLTIKAYSTGEVMVMLQVNPLQVVAVKNVTPLEPTEPKGQENRILEEPDMTKLKGDIVQHFKEEEETKGIKVHSIMWQVYTGVSDCAPSDLPWTKLWGANYVTENLLGLSFKISPNAFFQTNSSATEVLYKVVRDWALTEIIHRKEETQEDIAQQIREQLLEKHRNGTLNDEPGPSTQPVVPKEPPPSYNFGTDFQLPSLIFDVCCGTGTIGQYLAREIALINEQRRERKSVRVIGLELTPDAVQDALDNAKKNNLTNYTCIAGRAEKTIRDILYGVSTSDHCIAVVDPPRSGLHINMIRALRECHQIDRVIYVSCNPHSLVKDLAQFARAQSNNMCGIAFKPLRAVAVDMFPQTDSVESIILLQRSKDREYSPKDTSKYQEGVFIKKKKKNYKKKIEKKVRRELAENDNRKAKEERRKAEEDAKMARRPEQPLDPKFVPIKNEPTTTTTTTSTESDVNNNNKSETMDESGSSMGGKRRFEEISTETTKRSFDSISKEES